MENYQLINPTQIPDAALKEVLPGFDRNNFVGPDAGSAFDADGRPIMNLNDYLSYLDRTEPLFDDEMKTLITETVSSTPSRIDMSQFGEMFNRAAPAPNAGVPTVGEVVGTPGVDVSGTTGEAYKGSYIVRGGKPFVWDPQALKYVPFTVGVE
jgi:hypothetical protein